MDFELVTSTVQKFLERPWRLLEWNEWNSLVASLYNFDLECAPAHFDSRLKPEYTVVVIGPLDNTW